MSDLAENILRMDQEGDHMGIMKYVPESGASPTDIIYPIYLLLKKNSFYSAYILFKFIEKFDISNIVCPLAQCIGGMLFNNRDDEANGVAKLRAISPFIDQEHMKLLYKDLLEPVVRQLTTMGQARQDRDFILRTLEIMKAAFPPFHHIFNWDEPIRDLDIEAIRRDGQQNARLIQYDEPPAEARQLRRRAVVATRELMFPNQPWSRPLDIGPRIVEAMSIYGWDSHFFGMQWSNLIEDYEGAAALCRQLQADVLVLDDHMIESEGARMVRASIISALRQDMPNLKIVGAHFDTWALDQNVLIEASKLIDIVWDATSPSLPTWDDPSLTNKVLHCPYPHAVPVEVSPEIVRSQMSFSGSVKGYNWHRAFWLAAAERFYLPIEQQLSTHTVDGLPVLESYGNYMERLAESTCSLNFSMRPDLSCIVTGRSFETPYAGALQVQEVSPDMEYYFTVGEHYLVFETFADLRSILRFTSERKEEAEEIRRRGADFARTRYSDEKIIGYLDYMLHYQV